MSPLPVALVPPWVAAARAEAQRGPGHPRLALLRGRQVVGSIDPRVMKEIGLFPNTVKGEQLSIVEHDGATALRLEGDSATIALTALVHRLVAAGRCGPWRDEPIDVRAASGGPSLGTVERGAVRVLGMATDAVHLVGSTADGQGLWLQQRALTKPTHPGQWDTLMGGMVSGGDTLAQALARETWEEAGLQLAQLRGLEAGGCLEVVRPCDQGGPGLGLVRECIHWFHATLPEGVAPCNQDGEVERFDGLPHAQVQARLAAGAFTPEAALVLAAFYGW